MLDELRYYLMTKPGREPPSRESTPVQRDKQRLMRRLQAKRGHFG